MFIRIAVLLSVLCAFANAKLPRKRAAPTGRSVPCPAWKPFACPDGECIPLKWICDGSPDCKSQYDENVHMCTAAARPPVQETTDFLKAILTANGADFLTKIFGERAKNGLQQLGGVEKVAVALSESANVDEFGKTLKLSNAETSYVRQVLQAIAENNTDAVAELGLQGSEISDLKFYVDKLAETGFLN